MAPNHHSRPVSSGGSSYHAERLRHMQREEEAWAPPVLFNAPERNHPSSKDDDDDEQNDKSRVAIFKVPFDPSNTKKNRETFERKALIFEEGTPEDYIEFRKASKALTKQLGYTKDSEAVNVARALLAGNSLQTFEEALKTLTEENENENQPITQSEVLERTLNEVAKETFDNWEYAYAAQKHYLRSSLVMGFDQDPAKFCDRLEQINRDLKYYPRDLTCDPLPFKPLPEDELISIIDKSKKPHWDVKMLQQGTAPWNFAKVSEIKTFFNQLFRDDKLNKKMKDLNNKRKRK